MDMTQIIIATIQPFFSLLSLIVTGIIGLLTIKINKKMNIAQQSRDETNSIINSNTDLLLKNAMVVANRISDETGTKKDYKEAADATISYNEHMNKTLINKDSNS